MFCGFSRNTDAGCHILQILTVSADCRASLSFPPMLEPWLKHLSKVAIPRCIIYICICIYIYTNIGIYIYTCIYVHMRINMYTYIFIYTYIT